MGAWCLQVLSDRIEIMPVVCLASGWRYVDKVATMSRRVGKFSLQICHSSTINKCVLWFEINTSGFRVQWMHFCSRLVIDWSDAFIYSTLALSALHTHWSDPEWPPWKTFCCQTSATIAQLGRWRPFLETRGDLQKKKSERQAPANKDFSSITCTIRRDILRFIKTD